jgi:hypothetical protein
MPDSVINEAVSTRVHSAAFQQTSGTIDVSQVGNLDPSGERYILLSKIRLAVSGKDSSRTIALGIWDSELSLLGRTDNFTIPASTSAPRTAYKNLQSPLFINTTAEDVMRVGFWVSGKGAVYMQTDQTNQSGNFINYDVTTQPTIANFTNSGTYSFGSDASLIGNLDYQTLPGAPDSLVSSSAPGSITVNWTPPSDDGGDLVTSYVLQRARDLSFTTELATYTGLTETTFTQTSLTGGYYYRVAAINSIATTASTTGAYRTLGPVFPNSVPLGPPEPFLPGAPTDLIFTPSSVETSIDLSWTAPAITGNTSITQYRVRYKPVGSTTSTTVLTGSTSTSYTLSGLSKSTNFIIDVAAVNSVGTGGYSNQVEGYTLVVSTQVGTIKTYDSAAGGWRVLV